MLLDKSRDEIVAMVVTLVNTKIERQATFLACDLQQFGFELLHEERIIRPLVDKYPIVSGDIA
jgi:hypothetical protein